MDRDGSSVWGGRRPRGRSGCLSGAMYPERAMSSSTSPEAREVAPSGAPKSSRWVIPLVGFVLLSIVLPALIHGAPLADDYVICVRPINDAGYDPYLRAIWQDAGVVRPARFLELFVISKMCTWAPWWLIMLVPLALKFAVAFMLYRLLRELGLRAPWPEIGTALWLLEPLGTEAALWPAALHINLGLALALGALLLYRRGRLGWAGLVTLLACLCIEQVIFAFPLAVWLICPRKHRRRATIVVAAVVLAVLAAYAVWHGNNPRQAMSLSERFREVFSDPEWYVGFPIVGLGLQSGFLGFVWAFPYSLGIVAIGALGGAAILRKLLTWHTAPPVERRIAVRSASTVAVLIVLVNLPLITTEVGYSPRTFTPTWLVLAGTLAIAASRVSWRRVQLLGAIAGTFAAFAVLSLALSVSVRVNTVAFDRAAARWIAERTDDGDVVAVCDVERTVVEPAPSGSFHLHALHHPSQEWIEYYTGRVAKVRRGGEALWGARCPDVRGADIVVSFPELIREVG
jgi:hypothetical protein